MRALRLVQFVAVALSLSILACSGPPTKTDETTGRLQATVSVSFVGGGARCAGCRPGPAPPADHLTLLLSRGDVTMTTVTTDREGHFTAALPPGIYRLTTTSEQEGYAMSFEPATVTIRAGHETVKAILYTRTCLICE